MSILINLNYLIEAKNDILRRGSPVPGPRWNLRWVCLIQDNQSSPLNDCQTSALRVSPQPRVWFPLQISCYGHVLINLGVFDLEAPHRCQEMDYSEDAVWLLPAWANYPAEADILLMIDWFFFFFYSFTVYYSYHYCKKCCLYYSAF